MTEYRREVVVGSALAILTILVLTSTVVFFPFGPSTHQSTKSGVEGPTSTSVTCASSSFVQGRTTCVARVSGDPPSGNVTWNQVSGDGKVTFTPSSCTLHGGTCGVTVTQTEAGTVGISASYGGDSTNRDSSGQVSIITGFPSYAVAVNPNTNEVFAANGDTNTLVAINESSGEIVGNVFVGKFPYWIAVNPVTNLVYVTSIYTDSLAVVSSVNFEVVANITFASLTREVAVDTTTNKVFVSSLGDGTVSAISGVTNSVVAKVNVGNFPDPIAVNEGTHLVYVGNCGNSTTGGYISVISGLNYSIVDTIRIGGCPEGIVANPLTNRVYVSGPGALLVIDGATNRIISSIEGAGGLSLSLNPETDYIYGADGSSNSVVVVDADRGRVAATIPMGAPILSVAVNPATNLVFAANFNFYAIQIIDGRLNALVGEPVVGILKACVSATSGCDGTSTFAVTLVNNGTVAIEPTTVRITVSEYRGGTAVYATFNLDTSFTLEQSGPAQELVLTSWSSVANRTSTFSPRDLVEVQVCLPIGPCVTTNETVIP